ncbi:hypothetical protein FHS92_003547 [Sphingobium subterraneum]|jgi:hypothetical protein|uniref:Uncharacterized protein n=1 Tax=Sphingobium subterraneum TaxID=627688 RepID=A0A841J481_9SPHN|nr:hypothetical protein EP837_04097 [Sphingobium sp. EP60837]ANI80534.1 hypothetical protein EP837_04158 [Sphingobium sp. EP60837]MBB6125783.1 hypothetical protein [Sphingobium subterraneum]CAH0357017.1 hypothetical protein SPH9361_04666 [Sphingobium sp. CECT 9361]
MLVCSVIPPKGTQEKLWCEVKSFASNQKPRFSVPFPDAKI